MATKVDAVSANFHDARFIIPFEIFIYSMYHVHDHPSKRNRNIEQLCNTKVPFNCKFAYHGP